MCKKPRIENEPCDAAGCHARAKAAAPDSHSEGKDKKRGECAEKNIEKHCQRAPLFSAAQTDDAEKIVYQRA